MQIFKLLVVAGIVLATATAAFSQKLEGKVMELAADKSMKPLFGASVYWMNTTSGTTTDLNGEFSIKREKSTNMLIISYIGYMPDTVNVDGKEKVFVALKPDNELGEIDVVIEQSSDYIDYMSARNTQVMTEKELYKAACCNLSESFETNPSVDVSFTDAVTGTKQIKMLGLAGKYSLITTENYPGVRGLSSSYGLTYIPGTWIQSIQVTKGIGSVVNGYESVAGQINVELKKPFGEEDKIKERAFINVYANQSGRVEGNVVLRNQLNDRWNTATLLHGSMRPTRIDNNGDSFVDNPTGSQLNFVHRWKYKNDNNIFQIGLKGLVDQKEGGQLESVSGYHLNIDQKKGEVFLKRGYVFPEKPYKSVGFITSASATEVDSRFGERSYYGLEKNLYSNLIYQTIIGNSDHKIKFGASYMLDDYKENVGIEKDTTYLRTESVPGAFAEYSFSSKKNFNLVLGNRIDYHNLVGLMINPRLHAKYHPGENTTIRLTSGKGQRIANVFIENIPVFATNRRIVLPEATNTMYGLKAEQAWNHGISVLHEFKINYHAGSFGVDFYRTDFLNKVVTDFDVHPQELWIYNLEGKSYSNSFQAELKYEPFKRFQTKLAYRFYDVQTKYKDGWLSNPLIAQHRGFINMSYETRNDWQFDLTVNWNGAKRLPGTASNPESYQRGDYSPDFVLINSQVSKSINNLYDLYIGVENLTNFRQMNPIIGADDPFGNYFDSSIVWGPIFGRMVYVGARIRLNKHDSEKEY